MEAGGYVGANSPESDSYLPGDATMPRAATRAKLVAYPSFFTGKSTSSSR